MQRSVRRKNISRHPPGRFTSRRRSAYNALSPLKARCTVRFSNMLSRTWPSWNRTSTTTSLTLTARGRTAQESRAVIRCAARGRWFPSRASGGRVHRDPRNGLPQAQQKAQKSGKYLPNTVFQLPWRARTQQFAQDQAQVECADMDQLPLQNVFVSAQMATPHAARLVAVRETALDQLAAPPP